MMGNGANQNLSKDIMVMLGLDLLGNVGCVCVPLLYLHPLQRESRCCLGKFVSAR